MKKITVMVLFLAAFSTRILSASEPITVTIDSLSNVSGNGSLEACGKAIHKDGKHPLLVTLKHDQSYYTTLTAQNGVWCILFKRWTYNGHVDVTSTELLNTNTEQSNLAKENFN